MPEFLFILARFFLRVDGVLVRVLDARYFHRYNSNVLVKEVSRRECDYDKLSDSASRSVLTNPDAIAQLLPVTSSRVENIFV